MYCYLGSSFIAVAEDSNFGRIQNVKTSFCAVRLSEAQLAVDVGDLTFASTVISPGLSFNLNKSLVVHAPYAFVADCEKTTRTAQVDLDGTPFDLYNASAFVVKGFDVVGDARKVRGGVQLSVRGYCGFHRSRN